MPTDTGAPAWRLIMPNGGLLWAHDGRLAPDDLARALGECLYPSAPAWPAEIQAGVKQAVFSPTGLAALFGRSGPNGRTGPPLWGIRTADVASVASAVHFIQNDPGELRRLEAQIANVAERDPTVVVVVDGADRAQAATLAERLGRGVTVIADPDGDLAATFGVRLWPTTVALGDHRVAYGRAE
jgi:hypothetical protein